MCGWIVWGVGGIRGLGVGHWGAWSALREKSVSL